MTKVPLVESSSIDEARRSLSRTTVLAVAVSRYAHLKSLPGAAKDLELVKDIFLDTSKVGIYEPSRFIGLLNPTTEKVRQELVHYAHSRPARGDILIFYFSGHGCVLGTNSFGFCLTDSIPAPGDNGLLPLSVLGFREVVQTLIAVDIHPIFIIDACFSATTAQSTNLTQVNSALQDDLHTYAAGAYGLLCSSSIDSVSIDLPDGGAFTQTLAAIIGQGIEEKQQKYWPYVTLKGVMSPLQERMTKSGFPLPRSYVGPDLPEIPVARNMLFGPTVEYFAPYMRRIVEHLWNNGTPQEASLKEIEELGKGAYGNHSKLGRPPWGLVEDGARWGKKRTRRLTDKGKRFAQGEERIPDMIMKDPITFEWVASPDARQITISDVAPYRMERLEGL